MCPMTLIPSAPPTKPLATKLRARSAHGVYVDAGKCGDHDCDNGEICDRTGIVGRMSGRTLWFALEDV